MHKNKTAGLHAVENTEICGNFFVREVCDTSFPAASFPRTSTKNKCLTGFVSPAGCGAYAGMNIVYFTI